MQELQLLTAKSCSKQAILAKMNLAYPATKTSAKAQIVHVLVTLLGLLFTYLQHCLVAADGN